MTKHFIKKKDGPKKGPKYRTPDHFKGSLTVKASKFSGKGQKQTQKFNPTTFKTQHKG